MALRDKLIRRLVGKILREITVIDVRNAMLAMNASERQELLGAIRHAQIERVGRFINRAVVTYVVEPRAGVEADSMLNDGCDESDLERVC